MLYININNIKDNLRIDITEIENLDLIVEIN